MTTKKRNRQYPTDESSKSEDVAVKVPDPETLSGFPIVGIGASAGGLAAFEAFFSAMPADTDSGMAFVLVQHLAPDHKSLLTELIRRYTKMQVFEVVDGMRVSPNCAYIIPPNRDMALLNGSLQLLEPTSPRGQRFPIDFFFRSLAMDLHERAICIVLSGTGSDGTLGVRAIKKEGGMVMAQNPESTEYAGMPQSAIATGLVDYVIPPGEMPERLIAYAAHAFGKNRRSGPILPAITETEMKKVFVLLRTQTGHDFSGYKQSTINRRVERRMAVHQIERLEDYVRYLQKNTVEVESLFNDLLIGVTSFFRDPEAFLAFQTEAIPKMFHGKSDGELVRVWVPGCSTGEEAYSIAILLHEQMKTLNQSFKLQVFATDIDRKSVAQARSGIYPVSIADDVSPERLSRFFTHEIESGVYRVHKAIRDILVFSEHDVIKDPPFSKLDLIACRNLLIYLGGELQKKIIPLFHFALNPGGILFLGTSETVGEFGSLFATLDLKSKLYIRKPDAFGTPRPNIPTYLPPSGGRIAVSHPAVTAPNERKDFLREVTERALLAQYDAVGVLVDENGDILYLHGRTGRYLEPAPGEAAMNILDMAREGLARELKASLHEAATKKQPVRKENLRVKTNGSFSTVHLTVKLVVAGSERVSGQKLLLVSIEEAPMTTEKRSKKGTGDKLQTKDGDIVNEQLTALKQELKDKEERLQNAREEMETSNEELKSANEELQSVNEELQSTGEEMETSKEELQSVNEELSTVNSELQIKVSDLSQANNDMTNLLSGTGVGTIFLDFRQNIRRFTPSVSQVINLIPSDVGRPVGHIVSNLTGYESLVTDVQSVLDSLTPREVEVQTKTGAWFIMRIRPYRTLENVIKGAVISFFDITEMKRVQAELWDAAEKRRVLFDTMPQGVLFQDREERIIEANQAAQRIIGIPVGQMQGRAFVHPRWKTIREDGSDFPVEAQPAMVAIKTGQAAQGIIMGIDFPHKTATTWLRVNSIPLFKPGEATPYQVYTTFDDITEMMSAGKVDNYPGTPTNEGEPR